SAASGMTWWAGGRPCIEMGSRRTHEQAGVAAACAAYIAGFTSTSNLEAGRRYGVPTTGTAAHAFTLLHDTERDAFVSQVTALGKGTTLLVDTFDVETAVRTAIDITGPELGAVRLDSGDLPSLAGQVREQLDSLGATKTRIIVTSDLDEYQIAALAPAAVDGDGGGQAGPGGGHRLRPPDLRLRLQTGVARDVRRRDDQCGEEEPGQDLDRRPQVRAAPADREG